MFTNKILTNENWLNHETVTEFDFSVSSVDSTYFTDISEIMRSYGNILGLLKDVKYDMIDFFEALKNSGLSVFKTEENFVFNQNMKSIVKMENVANSENQLIYENSYFKKVGTITNSDGLFEVSYFMNFGDLKIYFSGGFLYIHEITEDKKYSIYMD